MTTTHADGHIKNTERRFITVSCLITILINGLCIDLFLNN